MLVSGEVLSTQGSVHKCYFGESQRNGVPGSGWSLPRGKKASLLYFSPVMIYNGCLACFLLNNFAAEILVFHHNNIGISGKA